jgi:hypothetical protein
MKVYAEHAGLKVTDDPANENIEFILRDEYGNKYPIESGHEMADISELFVKTMEARNEELQQQMSADEQIAEYYGDA